MHYTVFSARLQSEEICCCSASVAVTSTLKKGPSFSSNIKKLFFVA